MKPITERDIQRWLMREDTEIFRTGPPLLSPSDRWAAYAHPDIVEFARTKDAAIRKAIRAERRVKA